MNALIRYTFLFLSLFHALPLSLSASTGRTADVQHQDIVWRGSVDGQAGAMEQRGQKAFGRPTWQMMLKNIAWFGGPLAYMIYANNKIKKHHRARDIKLKEQNSANIQQQMMAQLMMQMQQGQMGMPGEPMQEPLPEEQMYEQEQFPDAAEVRQPVMPAGDENGGKGPAAPQAHDDDQGELEGAPVRGPEMMMPGMGAMMPGQEAPQQQKYRATDILSKKAYWFWQVSSWICAGLVLYHGAGLTMNTFALARSVLSDKDKMPNKPAALRQVEERAKKWHKELDDLSNQPRLDTPEKMNSAIEVWMQSHQDAARQALGQDAQRGSAQQYQTFGEANQRVDEMVHSAREQTLNTMENGAAKVEQNVCGHNIGSRFMMLLKGIKSPTEAASEES